MSNDLRPSRQPLRADRVHAELREVGIAGNRDGLRHVERAVRGIADIVANRPVPAGDAGACAPAAKRLAMESFRGQPGIQPQRRHRGDQLEGRSRRIFAVARAVEQLIWRCGLARRRRGSAHQRQHVAGVRVHHHQRAFVLAYRSQPAVQDLRGAQLQANVDGCRARCGRAPAGAPSPHCRADAGSAPAATVPDNP